MVWWVQNATIIGGVNNVIIVDDGLGWNYRFMCLSLCLSNCPFVRPSACLHENESEILLFNFLLSLFYYYIFFTCTYIFGNLFGRHCKLMKLLKEKNNKKMLLQQMLTPFAWKLGIFSFKYNFLCFCGNILITFIGLLFDVPSDMYIGV